MPNTKRTKKTTVVHEHPRHVSTSPKNPEGITIVDEHLRRIPGSYLGKDEIASIVEQYNTTNINFPTAGKLEEYPDADKYDDLIAIWTDYFNIKFGADPKLDPDVIKALIGSESGFDADPPGNKVALGIAQITKQTLKILKDMKGEAKDFTFKDINQKDLKNPKIALPMAIRWLFKKKGMAEHKLKKPPTHEEIILEYKGLLKSKTDINKQAIKNYREKYEKLKRK